ncbi:hypothetical protein [Burkholderia ubonensis]|uniref:hypothetical protein n=1 Tax=Burkholderia ubonensis TaxID=101571 RepID=UPI000ADC46FE|nr:hypothetical protein [Burkholderia ubonensis]
MGAHTSNEENTGLLAVANRLPGAVTPASSPAEDAVTKSASAGAFIEPTPASTKSESAFAFDIPPVGPIKSDSAVAFAEPTSASSKSASARVFESQADRDRAKQYCRELTRTILRYADDLDVIDLTGALEDVKNVILRQRYSPGLNAAAYEVFARHGVKGGL